MATYPFRFGRCTSPTFGSVTLDMIDLPRVQMNLEASDKLIGGSSRSLDGTLRQDRFALKREWPSMQLGVWMDIATWWPVKRLWLAGGPWMFYDHTVPNLLSGDQRLMQNSTWTNATGTPSTVRADGAVSLDAGGVLQAQMGSVSSVPRALLMPVVAGTQYFAAVTMRGTGTVQAAVSWWDAAGTSALSTTTLGNFTSATALSSNLVLDGSVLGYRIGGAATAPGGALYAQIKLGMVSGTADVSDPVFIAGPSDPGNAMTVVQLNEVPEVHGTVTRSALTLNMSEA